MNINYDDEKFKAVESEKQTALNNINTTYNTMLSQSDKFYQDQINAAKDYADTQSKLQQENTNLTIDQINQQKQQAQKDYTKEQAGAYTDWQKQSNQYGANAEQMAAQGLQNTGYSESSQVSMYNQYQSRVASARETFNRAVLNYDNSIKEAQLANNSKLAEIAYNALKTQLELSLSGFQYKNTLLQTQIEQQQQTEDRYYARWQDVLNQMNTENQFAESVRQYNQDYQLQLKQYEEGIRQYNQNYQLQYKQYQEGIRQFDQQIAYYKEKDAKENALKIKQLEEEKRQYEKNFELKEKQMKQEQSNWEKEYALSKQKLNSSSSSGSSSGSSSIKKGSTSSSGTSVNKTGNTGSTGNTSKNYTNVLNAARTFYNSTTLKSGQVRGRVATEDYLASAIAQGTINYADAQKILNQLGIK